jgi:hypothetical protein
MKLGKIDMRTVTGLFDNHRDATDAVARLESLGVPHADISLVANNSENWYSDSPGERSDAGQDAAGGAGLGAVVGGTGGLLTGLGLIAIPGLGPVVAAGWLVATAVGAVAGAAVGGAAGGMIGALTEAGVSEADANVYAEGVRRGGSLVTARVDDNLAAEAQDILASSHVDVAARRSDYEAEGWTRFDPDADDIAGDEVDPIRPRPPGLV